MLTFLASGLMFTTVYSNTPLWTFKPHTSPIITVTKGGSKQILYTIRNQSTKPKILLMSPIAGVSQSAPCVLPAKGSCTLTLNINGSSLKGDVLGGPVLCQRGNKLQCYQPSKVNSLHITLASKYSVGGSITGLSGTVTLQNNGANPTPISKDGSFTFSTLIGQGTPYAVTVRTQPTGQSCTVANGSGIMRKANVTNVRVSCTTDTAILSFPLTGTIPVNSGFSSFTVTNTSSTPAYNVKATLPISWSGVTQDFSNCAMIPPASAAPNNTCTLQFTSTTPYIAQGGIPITGDNVSSSTTTAFAFTVSSYLVWSVDSINSVSVIDTSNLPVTQWGNQVVTNANSPTDGLGNTGIINGTIGIGASAAVDCYNSNAGGANPGDWYLPAICQMGGAGQGAGCVAGLANIYTNLAQLGFGDFSPILFFWSSTESTIDPANTAWIEGFTSDFQSDLFFKTNAFFAPRCARTLPF